jgi:hypothetical protein
VVVGQTVSLAEHIINNFLLPLYAPILKLIHIPLTFLRYFIMVSIRTAAKSGDCVWVRFPRKPNRYDYLYDFRGKKVLIRIVTIR